MRPLIIGNTKLINDNSIEISLNNFTKYTRVHLFAVQFMPTNPIIFQHSMGLGGNDG